MIIILDTNDLLFESLDFPTVVALTSEYKYTHYTWMAMKTLFKMISPKPKLGTFSWLEVILDMFYKIAFWKFLFQCSHTGHICYELAWHMSYAQNYC